MVELLIIADDFTGAMDAGVQLAKHDTRTLVTIDPAINTARLDKKISVLSLDTDSRHSSPRAAFDTVSEAARLAKENNIRYIYKKTDSALRGNIGAELEALLCATGATRLHFIPAYPQNGRTTENGCQFIDGAPLHETAFANDPFSPVKSSRVAKIISSQSNVPATSVPSPRHIKDERGIFVYDAKTDADLLLIAQELHKQNDPGPFAGCAGFARFLPLLTGLASTIKSRLPHDTIFPKSKKLLVLCGSINEASLAQMEFLHQNGVPVITLAKCAAFRKKDAAQLTAEAASSIKSSFVHANIVAVRSVKNRKQVGALSTQDKTFVKDVFAQIAKQEALLETNADSLFVIGGDTLRAIMEGMGLTAIMPLSELAPGVVYGKTSGNPLSIISKSGGFGADMLVFDIAKRLTEQ